MKWLNNYLKENEIVHKFVQREGEFAHLSVVQEAMLLIGATKYSKDKIFLVKDNEHQAITLVNTIKQLDPSCKVVFYNQEESLRVEAISESDIMKADRIQALYQIITGDYEVCVTHSIAATRYISSPEILKNNIVTLSTGMDIEPSHLLKELIRLGYERVQYVDRPFTFSARGGIIDIYSVQMDHPVRIEFFDTEIESIRLFDIETQRSKEMLSQIDIVFAKDILLTQDQINTIVDSIPSKYSNENLEQNMNLMKDSIKEHHYEASMYPLLGYLNNLSTIQDYMKNTQGYINSKSGCRRNLRRYIEDTLQYFEERETMDECIYLPNILHNIMERLDSFPYFDIYDFNSKEAVYIPWHQAELAPDTLTNNLDILHHKAETECILIAMDEEGMDEITHTLINRSIPYQIFKGELDPGIYLSASDMEIGFNIEELNVTVYTRNELMQGLRKLYKYENKFSKAESIHELQDLSIGDYVVHRQYGIGRYKGIIAKEIEGKRKDFMNIEYRDGDELFIPVDSFNLLRKYLSSEALSVKLSKLGSSAWKKSKDKIKENVQDIAEKLIELYALRMESKGYAFSKDSAYQIEFEEAFPYALTPDQQVAITEIKNDMESTKPMDRLLCGDVGFGKTEVAIRAAFKAISDHKQVMFLCPTTILSAQHFRTLKKRFENYPVTIAVLNRFVSVAKQKQILKEFHEGKIDILIGTHRILSKDVKPKDLGLLIIDEEQRFGVEHKERIKEFKVSVDVLSLSATPIPRTLQMSLVGLRSLSQLNTPPSNRLPVMTYIIEKNKETINDIIKKELARDGQVFYLFNNVEQIYHVANDIQAKISEAKVAVIHGQMDRDEIEDVMLAFIQKEYNVLVCTTIIETGIDIPNANTILVDNAHRFGLSQLYQIKGRVGRSDRLAYAYFIVPEKKSLTEIATKRLQAIKEFTQLGSGYKIAMRDLTIRGAGELLGGNQSGFIDSVGMDLYIDLLKEAIAEKKGEVKTIPTTESVSLNVDGYLPEEFTGAEGEKLELYQQINNINSMSSLLEFQDMLKDRYGKLPNAVVLLIEKKRLEIFLNDPRIQSFKERKSRIELVFTPEFSQEIDGLHLFELVSNLSPEIKISYTGGCITITIPTHIEWNEDLLEIMKNIKEKEDETR